MDLEKTDFAKAKMMTAPEVWNQDNWRICEAWVDHHMRGDWFTSRLFRLWQTADFKNREKLARGFPDECAVFTWWMSGEKDEDNDGGNR